jgi:PAS domain S-box-containing protein
VKLTRESFATLKNLEDFFRGLDQSLALSFTDGDGRITYANDIFLTLSKFSLPDLLGQTHRVVNSNHHPESFWASFWKTLLAGRVWRGELKNKAKDGAIFWTHATVVPFMGDAEKPVKYLSIQSEITSKKKFEMQEIHLRDALINKKNVEIEKLRKKDDPVLKKKPIKITEKGPVYKAGASYSDQLVLFEKAFFEKALKAHDGNKLKTATSLGMYYASLHKKLKKYGLG